MQGYIVFQLWVIAVLVAGVVYHIHQLRLDLAKGCL